MSAFIVGDYHINYLLNWAMRNHYFHINLGDVEYSGTEPGHMEYLGNVLKQANYASIDARYGDGEASPFSPLQFEILVHDEITALQVIKACDCFDYQACEVDDYERTDAARIIDCIRGSAFHRLQGYDDAQWEVKTPIKKTRGLK